MKALITLLILFVTPLVVLAQEAEELHRRAEGVLEVWKEVQEIERAWAEERKALLEKLRELELERRQLLWRKGKLQAYISNLRVRVSKLRRRTRELNRINRQLEPFLDETYERLSIFVSRDLPFLREERRRRLERLREVLDSPDVPVTEKLRRVLEALTVEIEYGQGTEVTQEELDLPGGKRLVQVLRLGRVALFYRTLDGEEVGRFNARTGQWERVPRGFSKEIGRAMEMASKRRAAELIRLPIGRLER